MNPLPCSCGALPKIVTHYIRNDRVSVCVQCDESYCKERPSTGNQESRQEAIALWNRRAGAEAGTAEAQERIDLAKAAASKAAARWNDPTATPFNSQPMTNEEAKLAGEALRAEFETPPATQVSAEEPSDSAMLDRLEKGNITTFFNTQLQSHVVIVDPGEEEDHFTGSTLRAAIADAIRKEQA